MKVKFLPFGIMAVTVLLLTSCQKQSKAEQCHFRTLTLDKNIPLDSGKEPAYHITVMMDEMTAPEMTARRINSEIIQQTFNYNLSSITTAIDSFYRAQTREYKEKLFDLYQADIQNGMNANWYNYRFNIKTSHSTGFQDCISYEIHTSRYEGGAHEYNQTFYLNFNPENGEKILLNNIFTPNYQSELTRLLQDELVRQFNSKDIKELSEKGILNTTGFYITSNFKLGKDSMEFLYNVYEIAPYDIGPIRIRLSYKQLSSLLTTKN